MPLGLPVVPRGVEQEQRVLGREGLRLVHVGLRGDDVGPPDVAALDPADVLPGAPDDEDGRDVGAALERLVEGLLEPAGLAAPVAAVGGDDDLGLRVGDPVDQRLRGEAAEDDRVRGAEAGAGQHRDDRLGDHRQVEAHAVAGLHAERGEGVRGPAHLALQLGVGDRRGVSPSGSPTQWMATRSPWPASTCRSTQLTATLSSPSANHCANGGCQSRTCVKGLSHCRRCACSAQNARRSCDAALVRRGGNVRLGRQVGRRLEAAVLARERLEAGLGGGHVIGSSDRGAGRGRDGARAAASTLAHAGRRPHPGAGRGTGGGGGRPVPGRAARDRAPGRAGAASARWPSRRPHR